MTRAPTRKPDAGSRVDCRVKPGNDKGIKRMRRCTRRERAAGMGWRAALMLLATILIALPGAAPAHDLGVARAVLEELPAAHYVLEVETSPDLAELFGPPELPERCAGSGAQVAIAPGRTMLRYEFACAEEPVTAKDVLRLPWQRQGAMLTVRWADGSTARQFFAGTGTAIEVPLNALQAGSGSLRHAALRYLGLGIEHILLGIDHLLFVLGLLLIVRGRWMLIKTITAFLGAEILRARQGRAGLTIRAPWVVAFAFGLLHGLGFAGALTELGLPPAEIPLALLFFNVGVEIGQLMFVATFLALAWALRQLQVAWPRWSEPLPAYAIGTVAAFWFIERTSGIIAMA
jgi:hypothetical protein